MHGGRRKATFLLLANSGGEEPREVQRVYDDNGTIETHPPIITQILEGVLHHGHQENAARTFGGVSTNQYLLVAECACSTAGLGHRVRSEAQLSIPAAYSRSRTN
jgi:hypothetical protein